VRQQNPAARWTWHPSHPLFGNGFATGKNACAFSVAICPAARCPLRLRACGHPHYMLWRPPPLAVRTLFLAGSETASQMRTIRLMRKPCPIGTRHIPGNQLFTHLSPCHVWWLWELYLAILSSDCRAGTPYDPWLSDSGDMTPGGKRERPAVAKPLVGDARDAHHRRRPVKRRSTCACGHGHGHGHDHRARRVVNWGRCGSLGIHAARCSGEPWLGSGR
jgi:hypothetical protein